MKERPILFSGAMVRAILAGTKIQTRRIIKTTMPRIEGRIIDSTNAKHVGAFNFIDPENDAQEYIRCPYGQPGDRLGVKESAWMWCENRPNGKTKTGRDKWHYVPLREAAIHYVADNPKKPQVDVVSPDTGNKWEWRLKIGRFLPKLAVRIHLEIVSVRVERLQDISEEDAKSEGVCPPGDWMDYDTRKKYDILMSGGHFRVGYKILWESINGAGSWALNPWVWVVEFRKL